jgi:glyoxylase-like metal-dependent hydrolase (beta-lactamase superfamily II)
MRSILSVAIGLAIAVPAGAQKTPDVLEAYNKARALLQSAVDAHGGIDALRAMRTAYVKTEGWDYHPTQGRKVATAPPFDSTVRNSYLMVDLDRRQLTSENTTGWPGGFHYTIRYLTRGDSTWIIRPRDRSYAVITGADPVDRQYNSLFLIPQNYLLAAYENPSPAVRRYLGRLKTPSGAEVEAVHFTLPPQGNVIAGFDPRTHRLRALLSVGTDVFSGDTDVVTEFFDWKMIGDVLLPERVTQVRGGHRVREVRYVAAKAGHRIPDSLVVIPPGYTPATPNAPTPVVQELSSGIRLVGGGNKTLVVEFADHLVAVDAQSSSSAQVIREAATFAPQKPIRYVVPTHHHDDHFMGVRYYSAAGATIVTTPGNVDYLKRIMNAPTSSLMLASNQVPPSASYKSETMTGRRVFTDGTRTLEIHEIDSPHAEGMLVAWLPAEGILYTADLIEVGGGGSVLRGGNAAATVHLAEVIRQKGWNVRMFVGAHGSLARPEFFTELSQLPIIPPGQR